MIMTLENDCGRRTLNFDARLDRRTQYDNAIIHTQ